MPPNYTTTDDDIESSHHGSKSNNFFSHLTRHFSLDEGSPLLGKQHPKSSSTAHDSIPIYDRLWWRTIHAGAFCVGGLTFTLGTLLYYPAIYDTARSDPSDVALLGVTTAWLYTIGSAGFLVVDVQEFFTFVEDTVLRINIACSMVGSLLYLIGSMGFLPVIYDWSPLVGLIGFWFGSLSIGCSQTWKLVRILKSANPAEDTKEDRLAMINAACVEGGAMVGGFGFLIGTTFFWRGPIEGDSTCVVTCDNYEVVLALWVLGSLSFLYGGYSLAKRHIVLKIT